MRQALTFGDEEGRVHVCGCVNVNDDIMGSHVEETVAVVLMRSVLLADI